MASNSKHTESIRKRKRTKAGQTRKRKLRAQGSTPPRDKIVPPEK
jgi:hypothetical protein